MHKKRIFFSLTFIKISQKTYLTYYQRNKELISAKAKEYYQKIKDRLSTQARQRYRSFPEEKKKEIVDYDKNRRQNITEEDKFKGNAYMRDQCRNLPKEKKNERREYSKNRYHTMIKAC